MDVTKALWIDFVNRVSITEGNGVRTSFWNDDWIANDPFKDVLPDIFNPVKHLKIIVAEGWNLSFSRLLNDWKTVDWLTFSSCWKTS